MSTVIPTVRDVRLRAVSAPMPLPLQTSNGVLSTASLVLIDVATSDGVTGHAYVVAFSPANLRPIATLIEAMGAMVEGDALSPFDIDRKIRQKYALFGVHNMVLLALSGLDMALWDAHAQYLGQPLVRVLGGTPRPVRAYNSKGLGIMAPNDLAREAAGLLKEGFNALKVRLGRSDARDDVAAVRAVKDAIGPDVTLMCDFNQALTVSEAIRRGQMLDEEGGLLWIEEPVRADDLQGCARVAAAVATPIQIGENFIGPEQMAQAIALGASDFVMPDVQRIGGVTGWMRAAALAHGAGMEMSSHLFPEVSAHLLAVTPTCHWLEYVDWAVAILAEPFAIVDSHVVIPDRPGNGITWNEKAVGRYAA
ncbi:MAG: enolase C-terminal domain-like protein [Casimicrobiaceae bacterium]